MPTISRPRVRRTTVPALVFAITASGILLFASPAGAFSAPMLVAGGIAVTSASLVVYKNWNRIVEGLPKMMDEVIEEDDAKARELGRKLVHNTPGETVWALPALAPFRAGASKVSSKVSAAVEKVKRFVGDPRAGLAVDGDEREFYERENGILNGALLPTPPPLSQPTSPQRSASQANPRCPQFGVRDDDCPDNNRAESGRRDRVLRAVEQWESRPSGEEAQVAAFARNCWNQDVDRSSPKYEWFKTMMKRREQTGAPMDCRNAVPSSTDEGVEAGTSGQDGTTATGERYRAALNRSLGEGSEPSGNGYQAALDSLEEKEEAARREAARQRELEELERRTRLAAEAQERERRARVAERRQREAARASQPSYTYEDPGPSFGEMLGQALQGWADNLNRMQRQLESGTTGSEFIEEDTWCSNAPRQTRYPRCN